MNRKSSGARRTVMGKPLFLSFALSGSLMLATVAIGLAQIDLPPKGPIVAKDDSYTDSDGNHIQIDGLCSVSAKAVDCWSPTGKPDASLTRQVKAELLTPSVTFTAHYQRRTIFVAMKATSPTQPVLPMQCSFVPKSDGFSFGTLQVGGFDGDSFSREHNFYWFFAPKEQRQFDLYCTFATTFGASGLLSPKVGSETTIKGCTLKIQSISETKAEATNYPTFGGGQPNREQKEWLYTCEAIPGQGRPSFSVSLYPQDKELKSIGQFDENGKPIDQSPQRGYWGMSQSQVLFISPFGTSTPPHWHSPIDPQYVKSFDIQGTLRTEVEFPQLPLYPHR